MVTVTMEYSCPECDGLIEMGAWSPDQQLAECVECGYQTTKYHLEQQPLLDFMNRKV